MRAVRRHRVGESGRRVAARSAPRSKTDTISGCGIAQLPDGARLAEYRSTLTRIVLDASSPTLDAARDELSRGLAGLLGAAVPVEKTRERQRRDRSRYAGELAVSSRRSGSAHAEGVSGAKGSFSAQ